MPRSRCARLSAEFEDLAGAKDGGHRAIHITSFEALAKAEREAKAATDALGAARARLTRHESRGAAKGRLAERIVTGTAQLLDVHHRQQLALTSEVLSQRAEIQVELERSAPH